MARACNAAYCSAGVDACCTMLSSSVPSSASTGACWGSSSTGGAAWSSIIGLFFRKKKCDHLPRLSPGPLQDRTRTLLSHRNFPYSIAVISLNMIRFHRRFSPVSNEFHRRPSTQSSESRWLSMIRKGQHRIRHDGSLEVLKGLLTFSRPMWFRSRVNGLSAARW